MSYDFHVFGTAPLDAEQLESIAAALGQSRLIGQGQASGGTVAERKVRGVFEYAFEFDGPFRVERDDLPEAVNVGAVGVRWVYQLSVVGTSAASKKLAGNFARAIAERSGGVVYDPQDDAVIFPRGGTRRFKAEPLDKIDLVRFTWFARREDVTHETPGIVFDLIRGYLPEGLPRRFGSFEPLQGSLDETGKDGFVAAWRSQPMMLFWKGSRPCFGGSTDGLGATLIGAQHAGPHPVGSLELTFDHRAFLDDRWTDDAVALFVAISEQVPAFFAHAEVERNVGQQRGNLWYGPDAQTNPGLVVRNVWMGLPCFAVWLAWLGRPYSRR